MAKEGFGLQITEHRQGLPGGRDAPTRNQRKMVFSEVSGEASSTLTTGNCDRKSSSGAPSKSQVVGLPPVCNHRKKNSSNEDSKVYVKVRMDGSPSSGKLIWVCKMTTLVLSLPWRSYSVALELAGIALMDAESSECVSIYEDKDGDWMLLGDVSCP